jgi:tRNA threonylcarbamoyladenosine biosynthesis protein TsaE
MSNKVSPSPDETNRFGRELATRLRPGDCVALFGDLGSGKTCFVQGICDGLQVTDPVTSPTFVLINEYAGKAADGSSIAIYHFDLYRLGDPDELYDIGCDDFFYGTGVCLIEWADHGGDLIPDNAIEVHFSHAGEMTRNLTISGG